MNIPRVTGPIGYAVQMVFDRLISFLQRWLTLNVDAVANLAALAALDAAAISNGASKRVLTLRADFVLDKTSVLAADGITVVTALGGGRWIRTAPDQPDEVWQRQATWFINATTGNDEAGGSTSPTALKTWAELARRLGTPIAPMQDTVVTVETDLPDSDIVVIEATSSIGTFLLQGVPTVDQTTTVVSYSKNYAANQPCLIALAGFDAAGNTRKFIRFPNALGAGVDAWTIVLADLGNGAGGVFRCSLPMSPNGDVATEYVPVPGFASEVCTLPNISLGSVRSDCAQVYATGTTKYYRLQVRNFHCTWGPSLTNYVGTVWNAPHQNGGAIGNCLVDAVAVIGSMTAYGTWLMSFSGDASYLKVKGGAISAAQMEGCFGFWQEVVLQGYAGAVEFWTFEGSTFYCPVGMGYYPIAGTMTLSHNSVLQLNSGSLFGNCNGSRRPIMKTGGMLSYAAGSLVFDTPAEVSINGANIATSNLPYVGSDGSGAAVISSQGNAYVRPLAVGIGGAVANGTTYARTDLTGNVADLMPIVVTSTGFLKNLRGYAGTAAGGVTATVTVMINGVASAVTAATAAGGQTLSDTTHTVPVVAGDRVSFRVVTTNVGYSDLSISAEIV